MTARLPSVVFAGSILFVACSGGDRLDPAASSTQPDPSLGASGPIGAIDSLQKTGERAYDAGEIDSAQAYFTEGLELAGATEDSVAMARSLTWLAMSSYRLGDYEDAQRLGEQSLDLKSRLGLEDQLFRSYNILGLIAMDQARWPEAADRFEHALEAAEAARDSTSLGKVRSNLALIYTYLGDYGLARAGFLEARRLGRALGDPRVEGRALINLGMLDLEEGSSLTAIAFLEEAEPLLAAAEDVVGEEYRIGFLGVAYAETGALGEALALLDRALQQSRLHGLRQDEASNLEQLAGLHAEAGNLRRALQLFSDAKEIDTELGLTDELAMNLVATAEIHAELGNQELARGSAAEALQIHREIGARMREVEDLGTLADFSHKAGLPGEARALLDEAEALAAELGVPAARQRVARARARMAEREEDPRGVLGALAPVFAALPVAESADEWEFHALSARAYAQLERLDSAVIAGRSAIGAVERVRGAFASGVLRTTYLRKREAVYSDLALVLLQMGKVPEALEVADAARGRGLVEHLATIRTGSAGDRTSAQQLAEGERLLWRIEELSRGLRDLDEIALSDRTEMNAEEVANLHQALETARVEYSATLVRAAEAGAHEPGQLTLLGAHRQGSAEIQGALGRNEALLEYLLTPEAVLLFVVRRDMILSLSSEVSRGALVSRIRIARNLLGRPGSDPRASQTVLSGLGEVLLGPAEAAGALTGIERLIVVPHAELSYLPFAALRDAEGRYLAERYFVMHLPTGSALPALRDGRGRHGASNGASAFAPFPRELPASSYEVEAISESMADVRLHRGTSASEKALRQALADDGIVHAATHGILNARNPMFSRIELAAGSAGAGNASARTRTLDSQDDGRLEVHELLGMQVNSHLVFLSGCETGTSAAWSTGFAGGEEYATLAQAFLHAGADNVVATLWRVDDEGAAAFAEAFYGALTEVSPADALARAQRAMIRHPDYSAPYYWAAYRLSGSGQGLGGSQGTAAVAVRK